MSSCNLQHKKIGRNGEIDLLRFAFALMVVFVHSRRLFDGIKYFANGGLAVEFFFIVSGYFMMSAVEKHNSDSSNRLGTETAGFLLKKTKSFYLELILSYILGVIFIFATASASFIEACKSVLYGFIWDTSLLGMSGLNNGWINGPLWYISSMLIAMAIIYPLLRKWSDMMSKIVLPLSSVLILGLLFQNYGSLTGSAEWIGLTYTGNLRAFADLGIGVTIHVIVKSFAAVQLKKAAKVILTLIKYCCYALAFAYMCFVGNRNLQLFCLIFIIIGTTLTLSGQCVDKSLFNNKVSYFLGKLSLPIYFCHPFLSSRKTDVASLNNILPQTLNIGVRFAAYVLLAVAAGLIVMLLASIIRKKQLISKLKNCFVIKN